MYRFNRRLLLQVASLAGAGFGLSNCGQRRSSSPISEGPLKVGFIYVGDVGDFGWTFAHEQGRLELQAALGDQVITTPVADVDDASAAEVIRFLAEDEHRLIFATSFGFGDGTLQVAQEFPDHIFMHCTGAERTSNVGTYLARFEQPRYLAGMIAGRMTTSDQLGYIAAFPIPEVYRGINAFTLGARSVNPKVTVQVEWIKAWIDPAQEARTAESLIANGADVITQHTDSIAAVRVGQAKGMYTIGYHSNMQAFGPDSHLTACVHNWGPLYTQIVNDVLAGVWRSQAIWAGWEAGIVDLAPIHPDVPSDLIEQVDLKRQAFIDQTASPFDGPIQDQTQRARVAEGEALNDADQLAMDWLVDGVVEMSKS